MSKAVKAVKYPEFILAMDAEYVQRLFKKESVLDPMPFWYVQEGGFNWQTGDQKPNSPAVSQALSIRQRNGLETDPRYIHPLPYTVVGFKDENGDVRVTTYHRKKGGGEERLDGASSIGWGGHIEMEDIAFTADNDIDLALTIEHNVLRELQEEIVITDAVTGEEVDAASLIDNKSFLPLGFIYDTSNDVGKYHLAIVNVLIVPSHMTVMKRENAHLDGPVMTMAVLHGELEKYESWSQIIVKAHYDVVDNVTKHMGAAAETLRELEVAIANQKAVETQELALSAAMGEAAKQ
jgi:predicted NUDIX family phosphoesterase